MTPLVGVDSNECIRISSLLMRARYAVSDWCVGSQSTATLSCACACTPSLPDYARRCVSLL